MKKYVVQSDSNGKVIYADKLLKGNSFIAFGLCDGVPQPANYTRCELETYFKQKLQGHALHIGMKFEGKI